MLTKIYKGFNFAFLKVRTWILHVGIESNLNGADKLSLTVHCRFPPSVEIGGCHPPLMSKKLFIIC